MVSFKDIYEWINFTSIIKEFPIKLTRQTYQVGLNLAQHFCDLQNNTKCELKQPKNEQNWITTAKHIQLVSFIIRVLDKTIYEYFRMTFMRHQKVSRYSHH